MANEIGELVVKIAADISDIKGKMAEVKKSTDGLASSFESNLHPALGNLVTRFKALASPVGLASAGLVGMAVAIMSSVKAYADYGEALGKMSKQTGVSVESLSKLKYAAEQEETSLEAVSAGMKILQQHMALIGDTTSTETRFLEIADAVKNAGSASEKGGIAFKAFGRAGYELLPMLSLGSAGIKQLGDKAQALGVVIGQDAADKADKFNDSLNTMKTGLLGVAIQISNQVLPAFEFWMPLMEKALGLINSSAAAEVTAAGGRELTIKTMEYQKAAIIEGNREMQQRLMRTIELSDAEKQRIASLDKGIAQEKKFIKEESDALEKAAKGSVKTEKERNADLIAARKKHWAALLRGEKDNGDETVEEVNKRLSAILSRWQTHEQSVTMLSNFASGQRLANLKVWMTSEQQAQLANDLTELMNRGLKKEAIALLDATYEDKAKEQQKASVAYVNLTNEQKMANLMTTLNYISVLSTSKNKALAAVGKASAIATATIDAIVAGQKAWAAPPGPPWSAAYVALVIAAGMANVAKIAAVKVAKGGVVMPQEGGVAATVAEAGQPEAVIPLEDSRAKKLLGEAIQSDSKGALTIQVNISGQFLEANGEKWKALVRESIIPEIRRFTDISPKGPFTRRRGRSS
jgi:hypothetical protein